MKIKDIIKNGIWEENPVLVQAVGLCPTLAVTTTIENGFFMGLASTFVLLGSNSIVSIIRKIVPKKVRIPIYITIIATFVTIVQLTVSAYLPKLNETLGIFIPLIVVNCMILGRAEAFGSENNLFKSIIDALATGTGFTIVLIFMSGIREFFGSNKLLGLKVIPGMEPASAMILPFGGFLSIAILMGIRNYINQKKKGGK